MLFDSLYKPYDLERNAFGNNWCGPEKYVHGKNVLVARYEKGPENGDGQPVEVWCCAMPARFYEVRALAAPNSCGEAQTAFTLTTGSGMAGWAAHTAEEIARGMIGVRLG